MQALFIVISPSFYLFNALPALMRPMYTSYLIRLSAPDLSYALVLLCASVNAFQVASQVSEKSGREQGGKIKADNILCTILMYFIFALYIVSSFPASHLFGATDALFRSIYIYPVCPVFKPVK